MSTTNLTSLSFHHLAIAYNRYAYRATDPTRSRVAQNRAMWARERVGEEIFRRGALVRRSWTGEYLVGYASEFEAVTS